MAKLALAISLLFLTACHPKSMFSFSSGPAFSVGDCIAQKTHVENAKLPREAWETDYDRVFSVEKILEVGKLKYRVLADPGVGRLIELNNEIAWDNIMVKVPCTERLGRNSDD